MGKKVTECPTCGKAGYWQGVRTEPDEPDKIKHQYCGTIFNMSDWIYEFKERRFRQSDLPENWKEEERQKFLVVDKR